MPTLTPESVCGADSIGVGQSVPMMAAESDLTRVLADTLMLGSLLELVADRFGGYQLLEHWKQGEFHHDVVLALGAAAPVAERVLVVSTNCNGGVKEVLSLPSLPSRGGLWRARCPENHEFEGDAPRVTASSRTTHWFEPSELLTADARSELRAECRSRQCGGGWVAQPEP